MERAHRLDGGIHFLGQKPGIGLGQCGDAVLGGAYIRKRLFSVSGWRGAMLAEVAQHFGVAGGDLTVVFHVFPFAFKS
nr:MAG TPA: hypothetical protein [Caudoviricetes sp.]